MTDEQIVRTLAEFMGRRVVPATNGVCFWFQEDVDDGLEDAEPVSYLTSYDALAPVWQKIYDEPHGLGGGVWTQVQMGSKHWFRCPPREHAQALAQAIQETQK